MRFVCRQLIWNPEEGKTHEGNKKPFKSGDKGKRKFKGNGKKNALLRKKERN
jgi:hypothetical protein